MTTLQITKRVPWWLALVLRVSLFAALTAIGAKITIPLPFTPVPITLQVLFVIAAGLALGPIEGFASQLVYWLLIVSLRVDANGLGAAAFVGATAGYLWAFPIAAAVAGLSTRVLGSGEPMKLLFRLVAGLAGVLLIYLVGVSWLSVAINESWPVAWKLGATPFLLVDAAKVLLAASGISGTEQLWAMSTFAREDTND